jgi:purine-binding chemotaxis protein CheW
LAETDSDVTAEAQEEIVPEEEIRICLFSIGEDTYAIPVNLLTEIIIPQKVFPVPTTPSYVLGIINLRGNIVPLVDIRPALSLPQQSAAGQIAIVKYGAISLGIVVDTVSEVVSVPVSSVLTLPADYGAEGGKGRSRFIQGVIQRDTGMASLLNVERIFEEIKLT